MEYDVCLFSDSKTQHLNGDSRETEQNTVQTGFYSAKGGGTGKVLAV